MMLAKIALSAATFAIDRPYSYRVPAQLENLLEPGMRVLVPFGKGNRSSEGLVLSLEQAEETHRLKEIQTLLDRRPVLTPEGHPAGALDAGAVFLYRLCRRADHASYGTVVCAQGGIRPGPRGGPGDLGGQDGRPSPGQTGDDPPPRSRGAG